MSLGEQNERVKNSCNMEYFLTLFFNIIDDHEFGIVHADTLEEITETQIRASMEGKVSTSVDEFFDVYNTQWEIGDPNDGYSEPGEYVEYEMRKIVRLRDSSSS